MENSSSNICKKNLYVALAKFVVYHLLHDIALSKSVFFAAEIGSSKAQTCPTLASFVLDERGIERRLIGAFCAPLASYQRQIGGIPFLGHY